MGSLSAVLRLLACARRYNICASAPRLTLQRTIRSGVRLQADAWMGTARATDVNRLVLRTG